MISKSIGVNLMNNINDNWKNTLHSNLIASIINGSNTNESVLEEIGYCYTYCAPAFIYKYYRDNANTLQNIKANKIWFSAPCNFNDVFDCDIRFDQKQIFQSSLQFAPNKREILPGSPMWNNLNKTISNELRTLKNTFEKFKTTTGITCFSEADDSLLMWAHYANNHSGICVEYELLEINKQVGYSPVPVIYSDEKSTFSSFTPKTVEQNTISAFIKSLTSKSSEWSYEKEWRIIQDEEACGINWDTKNKGALLNIIRPHAIILGCMANADFENEIHKYCKENNINLYKMVKNNDLYKLDKTPILQFDE